MEQKIKDFAKLLELQQLEELKRNNLTCPANISNCKVYIKPGKKYTKVNVGYSGKYMVDSEGNIFGIKAYGQIHKGKHYGTLDTTQDYYWGKYVAYRKEQK